MNRRDLLRLSLTGIGPFSASRELRAQVAAMSMPMVNPHAPAVQQTPPVNLASYVTPLAIPPVIRPRGESPVSISMRQFRHRAHRDLPPSTMWGYNGMWPGPTFEVRKGQPIVVKWAHQLPEKHLLATDPTIHGADGMAPQVRTVTHVHGARALPESDGYPDAWVASNGRRGPVTPANPCHYPNDQVASTLWYHDHAMGITRLNVYAGLAGFYLVRDAEEESLNLPSGAYEIPLMIQDRSFGANGALLYPPAPNGTHPVWMQEFFGNAVCVNGRVAPFLAVEPRQYRFRMVNGSNARFYHLALAGSDAPPFIQIGSDGGLLPAPVRMRHLILSPGERFDIVVDFSKHAGANLALVNDAPSPYARGGEVMASDVMLFQVTKPLAGPDKSSVPDALVPFVALDPLNAVRERVLALTETDRASDGYTMIGLLDKKRWDEPISEDPKAGSTEIWSFANTTGDVHPMHVHLVQFQVLNRQLFDTQAYLQTGKVVFTGPPMPPESNERPAWKDTVKAYAGYLTRVIARFDLPAGTVVRPGDEFRYVWHCHVLEHEDNEMMRPYKVVG